ncbi:Pesticin receptor [termite gut metagenome]|uniref:Pesticin receptor n=1 Tax=termite gut metagenome TaxID=433724 RepID=A0A5J4RXU1_9ZZZZ
MNGVSANGFFQDTLKVVNVEEVIVIADPKENRKLREQPVAVTLLSQEDMRANQVTSLKNLTALVPNIFIPDYGSKLTSAIYIRGIGSRINTPAVGLYVDNVPYLDKSAYDFSYADIERIDVLRGPQGTLYGRNTMGGLVRVYTKSPFNYQGTDVRLSAGTYDNYNVSLTQYHRVSDKFAFSAGGFYESAGGFFDNAYLNKKIDPVHAGGGRIRSIYLPSDNLKLDLNVSYEYSDQGGYAYGLYDKKTGVSAAPAYNDESNYYRGLLNAGLNLEYSGANFTFNSVTGYQYLKDRMFMDQDFSSDDVYTLAQSQKQSTLTEEITFKSRGNRRWDWAIGAFGFYQNLKTDAPVTFKKGGLDMIESFMNEAMSAAGAPVSIKILDETMPVYGLYDTPVWGTALFHQSTFNDLFVDKLSATLGLRLDYEKTAITHDTHASLRVQTYMRGNPMGEPPTSDYAINGKEEDTYLQFLPKLALKYAFDSQNSVYASVSRGYRSGGYNIQMFSDTIQGQMRSQPGSKSTGDIKEVIRYKPEYSWNYETGSHLTLLPNSLWADVALFYTDITNQQIARFTKSGLGRIMVNAGRSRSYGAEASLRANITDAVSFNTNYGYTHATFTDYKTNQIAEGNEIPINYTGKRVPFVPVHTLSVGGQYTLKCGKSSFVDELRFHADYIGAGKIYWTEKNDVAQNFYGTLNWRISVIAGNAQVDFRMRNTLNQKYTTFYFESMGNGFTQANRPMEFGADVRWRF